MTPSDGRPRTRSDDGRPGSTARRRIGPASAPDRTDPAPEGGRRPGGLRAANRRWWDADADAYHAEHGEFLGEADLVWCPENLRESEAHLLGDVARPADPGGRLRVGAVRALPGPRGRRRWSPSICPPGCSAHARAGADRTGIAVPLVQADVCEMPFADASFDLAFSAFGAIPFVADSAGAMREVARVLRPGGRWVFAATHPMRWAFPDDPGPPG